MLLAKLKTVHDELAKSKLPPDEVEKLLKEGAFLVDVRPKLGAKIGMASGATNISLFTLKRRLHELPRDRKIVLYCHSGAAAGKAKQMLEAVGFKAFNGGGCKDVKKAVREIGSSRAAAAGPAPASTPCRRPAASARPAPG